MSGCPRERTLNLYLDGELSPAAAERLRGHMAVCEGCRRAIARLQALDEAVRREGPPVVETPDVAARVTAELGGRGAFLKARLRAGRRRIFGESMVSVRMATALALAAGIVFVAAAGMERVTRDRWARRTAPVLADAEQVLVRLVYVTCGEEGPRLAWARDEARKLGLSPRLAEVRLHAGRVWSQDLAPLEETFTLLAGNLPLPPDLAAQLGDGELLAQATRLREDLAAGG